jgi:hypothetical protein
MYSAVMQIRAQELVLQAYPYSFFSSSRTSCGERFVDSRTLLWRFVLALKVFIAVSQRFMFASRLLSAILRLTLLRGDVGSAGGLVGHTGLPAVMVMEPAGNVMVDKVEDEVLGAAGGNVVMLLLKQIGQSPHCR